jgi:amidase
MYDIGPEWNTVAFRPDAEPALRIRPGECVRFATSPEPVERLFAAGEEWIQAIDIQKMNAVTGPVSIEGAELGDAVAVEILDVRPGEWGFSAFLPGFGLLGDRPFGPMLRRLPIRDGRIIVSDRLSMPVSPMIGCLGLAPATGESSTLRPAYPWGGNYDLVQAKPGNTLLFPVQVPGGLFSLGDLHAAMGRAEGTYVAIECPGTATVRLGLRKGLQLETPRIEAPGRLYTVGLADGVDYVRARQQAMSLMFAYLTDERGLTAGDAYVICSGCVDLEFGGPAGAVVLASVSLSAVG